MAVSQNVIRRLMGVRNRALCAAICASALLAPSTGCTILPGLQNALDYSETCNDAFMGYRNNAWAAKAWYKRKNCYCRQKHIDDFGAGFRAGYEDVANGGNGCTPAFAPREYWGWKYQSPVGQQRVSAWFAGYPLGAQAAEEDGLGNYANIMMSGAVRNEFEKAGCMSESPMIMSPLDGPTPAMDAIPGGSGVSAPEVSPPVKAPVTPPEKMKAPEPKTSTASRRRVPLN